MLKSLDEIDRPFGIWQKLYVILSIDSKASKIAIQKMIDNAILQSDYIFISRCHLSSVQEDTILSELSKKYNRKQDWQNILHTKDVNYFLVKVAVEKLVESGFSLSDFYGMIGIVNDERIYSLLLSTMTKLSRTIDDVLLIYKIALRHRYVDTQDWCVNEIIRLCMNNFYMLLEARDTVKLRYPEISIRLTTLMSEMKLTEEQWSKVL